MGNVFDFALRGDWWCGFARTAIREKVESVSITINPAFEFAGSIQGPDVSLDNAEVRWAPDLSGLRQQAGSMPWQCDVPDSGRFRVFGTAEGVLGVFVKGDLVSYVDGATWLGDPRPLTIN
jgi:hypothetical protein